MLEPCSLRHYGSIGLKSVTTPGPGVHGVWQYIQTSVPVHPTPFSRVCLHRVFGAAVFGVEKVVSRPRGLPQLATVPVRRDSPAQLSTILLFCDRRRGCPEILPRPFMGM
jgi:hypothetical protein